MRPSTTGQGNFAISLEFFGNNLEKLDAEAGGHRWQRIPPTEKKGRIHTSTITVSVVEPIEQRSFVLNEKDLHVSWFSGTGKGGQNRNKVQSCCRLTHLPSGITITAQTRSRENSFKQAKDELQARLVTLEQSNLHNKQCSIKKAQIGSGQRGDKIRTYRLQHDEIDDHRSKKQINVRQLFKGMIDLLWI